MHTDLHDDDAPIGRLLTRREILIALGGAGASGLLLLTGCGQAAVSSSSADSSARSGTAAPDVGTTTAQLDCVAKPEMTQGPYFVDEKLNRSDVRSEPATGAVKAGALFALTFNVSRIQSNACSPLPNAIVDIWQCDALGVYSDASDPSFNTLGQKWLRGHQVTDASGTARFTTILPGWYPGRASHIHFKIRGNSANGAGFDFTSQLFFPEEFLSSAYSRPPYSSKDDTGRRRNESDGIFRRGGSQLLLVPEVTSSGYAATFKLGLNV